MYDGVALKESIWRFVQNLKVDQYTTLLYRTLGYTAEGL